MDDLVKFDRIGSTSASPALPAHATELRRFSREKLCAQGSMRFGGRGYTVAMENLSEQGCQFWVPRKAGLPKGTSIALYIEKMGPFPATVRWAREGWVGVEFDQPLYGPVLRHIQDHFDQSE
jgi:hypothetical protein